MRIGVALVVGTALLAVSCGGQMAPATPLPPPPDGMFTLSVNISGPGRVISIPPGIDCPASTCLANFPRDTSVTLAASPTADGQFMSWSGDCAGAMGCFVAMERQSQVMAIFTGMGMGMMLQRR